MFRILAFASVALVAALILPSPRAIDFSAGFGLALFGPIMLIVSGAAVIGAAGLLSAGAAHVVQALRTRAAASVPFIAGIAAIGAALVAISVYPAFAADTAAAPADTTVSFLDLYKFFEPYLVALVGVVFSGVLGWLAALLKTKFGLDIDAGMRATLQSAAYNGATRAFAQIEGPVANLKIDVKSPLVADAVRWIETAAPDAIKHFGLGPDELAALALAKLGAAQVVAASPAPSPSA